MGQVNFWFSFTFRALVVAHFCQGCAFWNVFAWLPMYFEEHFPGNKVGCVNFNPLILQPSLDHFLESPVIIFFIILPCFLTSQMPGETGDYLAIK